MFIKTLFILILVLFSCGRTFAQNIHSPLKDRIVFVDAGHGGTAETDSYRVGPSGEREEWINLRVALILQELLEERGARVVMARTKDINISLDERARKANEENADVFVSIHHNATADPEVNFPIIYFHGNATENKAGVELGRYLAEALVRRLHEGETQVSLVSDHTIFPTAGARVLRKTYGIPGVLAEASFFTNPDEENRLKQRTYNHKEAMAYVEALEAFFSVSPPSIEKKHSVVERIPPFEVFQEAERMNKTALSWHRDFIRARELMQLNDTTSMQRAYELFTRSARSFPDSYVAAACHRNRALLLKKLGQPDKAQQADRRVKEFYVNLSANGTD